MNERPNLENTLARLKDFQRTSVDYVFRRLYLDQDRVDRFLLADEVGLGKTLVARGVIARAVDHLWDGADRIAVVYVCSNGDIARQNINRLRLDEHDDFAFASRLTLLPLHTRDLASRKLSFVSFTPGTSFDFGKRSGMMAERALLYYLLKDQWSLKGVAPINVLQGGAGDGWRDYLARFARDELPSLDLNLAAAFADEINRTPTLADRFLALCDRFRRHREKINAEDREERNGLVGDLRRILATCCVKELRPDLVILDEFQRFRHLLEGHDEVAQLANELFRYRGSKGRHARALLLSATPYKMYTVAADTGDDNHYRDFLKTTRFLFDSDSDTSAFESELRDYRAAVCLGGDDEAEHLVSTKKAIERRLRRVMCRTERLGASTDRNGMLAEVQMTAVPTPSDVQAFTCVDRVATLLDASDHIELWKSGGYLLNFMDDYDLKRRIRRAVTRNQADLRKTLRDSAFALFQSEAVQRYEAVDANNARLRALLADSVDRGGWKALWVPPSLPYYSSGGVYADPTLAGFTKALVFSSWRLAPKVIAAIASYEAERRMVRSGNAVVEYGELRERQSPLLRFAQDNGRLTGMPLFTLLYPCPTLAFAIDPLDLGRRLSNGKLPNATEILVAAEQQVHKLLEPILRVSRRDGSPDERWYWAALLMLDHAHWLEMGTWLRARDDWAWRSMAGDDDETQLVQHVNRAQRFFEQPDNLGAPPADLAKMLAKVAVGSPAVVALRALARRWPQQLWERTNGKPEPSPLLSAAAYAAMGFRALFNRPEVILLLRGLNGAEPYWERVLDYAIDGNLQSVIDEYTHVLVESLGLDGADSASALEISEEIHDAVSLRTTTLAYDQFVVRPGHISEHTYHMRCNYALRFGDGEGEGGGEAVRQDQVRAAFNSPFRPFILASTSVGQEGLDFHLYCRAVYHWNLPTNPVDLEQREGRVHRYKGYAIRNNLAAGYSLAATVGNADPWEALFQRALKDKRTGVPDIVPYWVLEGPCKIERRVPLFPLSREISRLEYLKASLALYRLVFGQPRQEDLIRLLRTRFDAAGSGESLVRYQVDLAPPPAELPPVSATSSSP